jgi:hypothetical protein
MRVKKIIKYALQELPVPFNLHLIRIRNNRKCWIRIRIQSKRIRNADLNIRQGYRTHELKNFYACFIESEGFGFEVRGDTIPSKCSVKLAWCRCCCTEHKKTTSQTGC